LIDSLIEEEEEEEIYLPRTITILNKKNTILIILVRLIGSIDVYAPISY